MRAIFQQNLLDTWFDVGLQVQGSLCRIASHNKNVTMLVERVFWDGYRCDLVYTALAHRYSIYKPVAVSQRCWGNFYDKATADAWHFYVIARLHRAVDVDACNTNYGSHRGAWTRKQIRI